MAFLRWYFLGSEGTSDVATLESTQTGLTWML